MSATGLLQLGLLILLLAVTVGPLGRYMALVYGEREGGSAPGDRVFLPIERSIYRLCRVDHEREQRWNVYALSLLSFSLFSFLAVYSLQRFQTSLPFNPTDVGDVAPYGAFNVAVSFMTNTNWQWYSGELTMSHLTQMVGLTVQNFVSAAAGMAIVVAIIRGLARRQGRTLGNFWVDLTRTTTRILLPMSFVMALALTGLGVVQNLHGSTEAQLVDTALTVQTVDDTGRTIETPLIVQTIPGGPVASQIAIKQLGTNGGGFFNANSAHPFENPDGWTNLLETYALVLIPFAFCITFGRMVGSRRQGTLVLGVMATILVAMIMFTSFAETGGNPQLDALGVDQGARSGQVGGNSEGKEIRFGPSTCATWAASTTGTSNGSVNCMHDSFTPLGGMIPLIHMTLGEVSPGGVGVGLMGMLVNVLLAVFIAGLMVGRTPEFLGKKIQSAEIKLVVLYVIAMPLVVLGFGAATVLIGTALNSLQDNGPHGLTEVLYNFASAGNNNGSAFAYMSAGTDWFTTTQGLAMLVGRFFLIIPALALGGSLVRKQRVPVTAGTFPTDTPLFGGLVIGVVFVVAGLTFFPALALGPIVEHLSL